MPPWKGSAIFAGLSVMAPPPAPRASTHQASACRRRNQECRPDHRPHSGTPTMELQRRLRTSLATGRATNTLRCSALHVSAASLRSGATCGIGGRAVRAHPVGMKTTLVVLVVTLVGCAVDGYRSELERL